MELNSDSERRRKLWLVLSDVADTIVDLLPSNVGRQSLVSSLHRAYGLDLKCEGLITIKRADRRKLEEYHEKSFVKCLLKKRNKIDKTLERYDEIEALISSGRLNHHNAAFNIVSSIEDDSDSEVEETDTGLDTGSETETSSTISSNDSDDDLDDRFGLTHDCYIFPFMAEYVKLVAGTSLSAAQTLVRERSRSAQTIAINWYGGRHHCKKSMASGYCYVNDIIISISELRKTFKKVFYLDLDLHHGDGVEKGYEYSKNVTTCSVHRFDLGFYPGSGSLESSSKTKFNIPTKRGLSDTNMMYIIDQIVSPLIRQCDPDAIVIQCGCDGLGSDEHKEWNLTIDGYAKILDHMISQVQCPVLLLGGGGYNNTETAKCWTHITKTLLSVEEDWDIIPEHEHLESYEADGFQFWTMENKSAKMMPDHNDSTYLNSIKDYIEQIK